MFGLGLGKHKRLLMKAFSECFQPLKDELGNVPLDMQTNPEINASILGVCRSYCTTHNIKTSNVVMVADAVFEELYRRESIAVQTRVDSWESDKNEGFMQAYEQAVKNTKEPLDLSWLTDYAEQHFKPATGLML